jgi:tetratricopeptide (TPR) repeat protein
MPGNEQRFQQAMNQGHSAAWDEMWEDAASFYRQALEEFPEHPKVLTSLGLALYQLQNYDEALQFYKKAAQVSPNDPMPLEKVAELLERVGQLDQASEILMRAAELYVQTRDVNKAIELWSSVVSLKPDYLLAHSRLALVYERVGQKQKAVVEYLAIASLLQNSGEVAKAIQTANHTLQLVPDSKEVAQALAMLQAGQRLPKPGRPRGATGPLRMAQVRQLEAPKDESEPTASPDPISEARQKALTVLAGLLFELTTEENPESQAARRGLQALVRGTGVLSQQVDQTKILLHLSQVIDQQARGANSQALTELEHAIEAGLDHPAAHFDLGLLMSEVDRLESATRSLQRAVKHTDFALGARLLLGGIFLKMGRCKEASIEYLEALRLSDAQVVSKEQSETLAQLYDPIIESYTQQSDADVQSRLCQNVSELLQRANWRQHLTQARQQLPPQAEGDPPLPLAEILTEARSTLVVEALTKINQLARAGMYRTAMEEAFFALQAAPTYLPLHISMADLLLKLDRIPDAVNKLSVIARSYSNRGEASRAIEVLRRIVELTPMNLESRNRLIEQLAARGQTEEAANEYLKLAETYYSLADLAAARKTYTAALRWAQQVNLSRAWRVTILHRMADVDLQSLDWRQALRVFEQIRTLQPDDEKACTALVEINYRLGQEAQALSELDNFISTMLNNNQRGKAIEFVERIVSENPKHASIRRRLAELYRQAGRATDAIEQLDAAGDLFLEAGNRNAATESIMALLALNPPNVAEYQEILAQLQGK